MLNLQEPRALDLSVGGVTRTTIPFLRGERNPIQEEEITRVCQVRVRERGECEAGLSFDELFKEVRLGMDLPEDQMISFRRILKDHEKVFVQALGRANCYTHEIKMEECAPRVNRTYPIPY